VQPKKSKVTPKTRKRLANHDSRSENPDSSTRINGDPVKHPKHNFEGRLILKEPNEQKNGISHQIENVPINFSHLQNFHTLGVVNGIQNLHNQGKPPSQSLLIKSCTLFA
jgi:hypothetical protein